MTVAAEIHKSRWTGERIARRGFRLGLGWDAKRIAEDPIIASTPTMCIGKRKDSASRFAQRRRQCRCAYRPRPLLVSRPLPPSAVACLARNRSARSGRIVRPLASDDSADGGE